MDAFSGDLKGWSLHLRLIKRRQAPHLCYKSLDFCPPLAVDDVNSQNVVRSDVRSDFWSLRHKNERTS